MRPEPDGAGAAADCLTIQALRLRRRDRTLIEDLSVRVAAGETLAVMGRSGTGKTTLLRTIAGLSPPQAGSVRRPGSRVAMVFQDPRLLPWRTALQNVELACPQGQRATARQWLERVGLGHDTEVYPGALSGGMRQRVAIARALAHGAQLVLVDEPFASLDTATAQALRRELVEHLSREQRTVVWVTHDPAEAAAVARRTLIIDGPPSGTWRIVGHDGLGSAEAVAAALQRETALVPQPSHEGASL